MLIVYGPTATGKTDFALALAQNIPAEIINMDVGQLYAPLTIGTAKPDWRTSPIPHHLFDYITDPVNYSVIAYRKKVCELVGEIRARGTIPLLVGGSGFYLSSLFYPPFVHNIKPKTVPSTQDCSGIELWQRLFAIDPERAEHIQRTDTYRIQRALDLWYTTGVKPSLCKPVFQNDFGPYHILYIDRDRDDLYHRINLRVQMMLAAGWIDEVQKLEKTPWITFLQQKKLIGYDAISAYLMYTSTASSYQELATNIQTKTRHYARRQAIFWRMFTKKITTDTLNAVQQISTINLTSTSHTIYLKQLADICKNLE